METVLAEDACAFEALLTAERPRLVHLCAYLTGNRNAAEDLAQDALIEAWRHREKLIEPTGSARWLSTLARNACLRWIRQQGRQRTQVFDALQCEERFELAALRRDPIDLEIELERDELAMLLDRALALLPPETRDALIYRYILELPQTEIAARLNVSEGAVEARLHRGKLSLHRILVTNLYDDAKAFGLIDSDSDRWQETRIWCSECGQHRLWGRLPQTTGEFELHCPNCSWQPDLFYAQALPMPCLEDVKGFRATLRRFSAFMDGYLTRALTPGSVSCVKCGYTTPLHLELPPHVPAALRGRRGLHVKCETCGAGSYADLDGLALNLPQAQDFWRRHPKIRTLPQLEIDANGQATVLVRFESVNESAQLNVAFSRERYEVLGADESSCD